MLLLTLASNVLAVAKSIHDGMEGRMRGNYSGELFRRKTAENRDCSPRTGGRKWRRNNSEYLTGPAVRHFSGG